MRPQKFLMDQVYLSDNDISIEFMEEWLDIRFAPFGKDHGGIDCIQLVIKFFNKKGLIFPSSETQSYSFDPMLRNLKLKKVMEKYNWLSTVLPCRKQHDIISVSQHFGILLTKNVFIHACLRRKRVCLDFIVDRDWANLEVLCVRPTNVVEKMEALCV